MIMATGDIISPTIQMQTKKAKETSISELGPLQTFTYLMKDEENWYFKKPL